MALVLTGASFTAVTLTVEVMAFELVPPSLTVKLTLRVVVFGLSLPLA